MLSMPVGTQLCVHAHAIRRGSACIYDWMISDLNAASHYVVATGCGRDHRDKISGALVAVGKAVRWIKDEGRVPRQVVVVTMPEVALRMSALDKLMMARIDELLDGVGDVRWENASKADENALRAQCVNAANDIEGAEREARKRREAGDGKDGGGTGTA